MIPFIPMDESEAVKIAGTFEEFVSALGKKLPE
jgi:hypothetical protein